MADDDDDEDVDADEIIAELEAPDTQVACG